MALQKDPEGMETLRLHQAIDLAGLQVLEIGCGDGRLTWRYAHAAGRVVGIDPLAEVIKDAPANCPSDLRQRVSFSCANVINLPFNKAAFAAVILAWSF
jgi:ubiquinone/menaquinone biosynthesis C-methylase UbiE